MSKHKTRLLAAAMALTAISPSPVFAGEAGPVFANPFVPATPAAAVRVLSSSGDALRWHGAGDLRSVVQMCVTSTTGRYQLAVTSSEISAAPTGLQFKIGMGDAASRKAEQSSAKQALFTFEGAVDPSYKCAGVANVSLSIYFDQSALMSAVSGEYLKTLQISVSPL